MLAHRARVMGPMLCCSRSPAAGLLTPALAAARSCSRPRVSLAMAVNAAVVLAGEK